MGMKNATHSNNKYPTIPNAEWLDDESTTATATYSIRVDDGYAVKWYRFDSLTSLKHCFYAYSYGFPSVIEVYTHSAKERLFFGRISADTVQHLLDLSNTHSNHLYAYLQILNVISSNPKYQTHMYE